MTKKKRSDYQLFKDAVELMSQKKHLTPEGLQQIVNLKAVLNRGLSGELKLAFPNTQSTLSKTLDRPWIAGFSSGEACFFIKLQLK